MEERFSIAMASGLTLEAWLGRAEAPRGGLVVCHPHPLYGGDMDNPVVVRAAEVAREAGVTTLRFNFRGVGASSGVHDRGEGEQDDVRAAIAALRPHVPGCPVALAGYSFGASVSSRVAAQEPGVAALCLIAPPLTMTDVVIPDGAQANLLVVAGTRDLYCPEPDLDRLATRLGHGAVARIDGADHFFFGKLFPLGEAIRGWVAGWVRR